MNPKQGLARASELIKQKRYKEAKKILVLIDHPKADEWLNKINEIETDDPFRQQAPIKPNRGWGRAACGVFLILLLIAMIGWVILSVNQSGSNVQRTIDAIEFEMTLDARYR